MTATRARSSPGWLTGLLLLAPIMAWAAPEPITSKDQQFLTTAAEAQKVEVVVGQMVLARSDSETVKRLARRMVDDHTKAGQELRKLAEAAGVTLPDELSAGSTKTSDAYEKLSGTALDRVYVDHEVKAHFHNIAEFKKQAKKLKHSQIKQWASGTLPVLKEHLVLAKSVRASLKSESPKRGR